MFRRAAAFAATMAILYIVALLATLAVGLTVKTLQPRLGDYGWYLNDDIQVNAPDIPQEWRGKGAGKTRLLYQAYAQVTGETYAPRNQRNAPSCVGHATAAAVDILAALQGHHISVDASTIYGFSRQEIGQLGADPRGGSHNAWAARAINEYGLLFQQPYLVVDLTHSSPTRDIEYGREGVPDALEPTARLYLVAEYYQIHSYAELRDAVVKGCPVIVGSNVGFGVKGVSRDRDGFLNRPTYRWWRRNTDGYYWFHSMVVVGVSDSQRKGALFLNSWGEHWVKGPQRYPDQPEGTFWADASIVDGMVKQGDSFALKSFEYVVTR